MQLLALLLAPVALAASAFAAGAPAASALGVSAVAAPLTAPALASPALAAPALTSPALTSPAPASPAADELVVRAAEGATVVRVFETSSDLELVEMALVVDGEEHSPDELPEVTIEGTERIVVTDEVLAAADGRATRLRRTYDELVATQELSAPDEDKTRERESELEGETVVVAWDEDDEAWTFEAEDDDLDSDLLEGLRDDLDLSAFLPDGEVDEGDSWDVPIEAFGLLFAPAGELHLVSDDDEESGVDRVRVSADLLDSVEGEITATYRGARDEDGTRVGVIELAIEAEMEAELDDEGHSTITLDREVEGELLWDLERGRLHALELDGDLGETITNTGTAETPDGGELDVEQRQRFEGTISYRFRTE